MGFMKITIDNLIKLNACESGIDYYKELNSTDPDVLFAQALKDERFYDANWLLARLLSRKQAIAYAIFAAEKSIHIYEAEYPDCHAPRMAIEAAKEAIKLDSKQNRRKASIAACAAYKKTCADKYGNESNAARAAWAAFYAANAASSDSVCVYTASSTDAATSACAANKDIGTERKIVFYGLDLLMGRIVIP